MKLKIAGGASEIQVSEETFGREFNEALVHQVVTAYRNAGRAGSKAQLTRAEVRGGGRKPRPQKGGGTSRAGSIRSPIWVGGGRAFAAKPRGFEQKVNRKMYRGAMRSMLSELARQDRLLVTDGIALDAPKTKQFVERLRSLSLVNGPGSSLLVVVEAIDEKLFLAARNLPHVQVLPAAALNPLALASHDKVLMTVAAAKLIDQSFSSDGKSDGKDAAAEGATQTRAPTRRRAAPRAQAAEGAR